MADTHDAPYDIHGESGEMTAPDDGTTYSISELSAMFSVTPRAIRFYESKGLLSPARRGMTRIYSRRDRARLALILRGKRVGFSLVEIKEILDLYDLEDGQEAQLRHAKQKFEERIGVLSAQRRDIDDAIAQLNAAVSSVEQTLQTKYEEGANGRMNVVGFSVSPSEQPA